MAEPDNDRVPSPARMYDYYLGGTDHFAVDREAADPRLTGLIDLDRPPGLLLVAVLHFVDGDAAGLVARYRRRLAAGGYLTLSVLTAEGIDTAERRRGEAVYAASSAPLVVRTRAEVEPFFDGCDMVEPGLVPVTAWRAEEPDCTVGSLAGVGRIR